MSNYLLFLSQEEAIEANNQIIINSFPIYQMRGYQVINNSIVSKNAATGEDVITVAKTNNWAIPQYSNDYWYILDPRDFLIENTPDLSLEERGYLIQIIFENVNFIEIENWSPETID